MIYLKTLQSNSTTTHSTWATAVPHKVQLVTAKSLYLSIINFIISAAACRIRRPITDVQRQQKMSGKTSKFRNGTLSVITEL